MKNLLFISFFIFFSCKFLPDADKQYSPGSAYHLRINPDTDSKYYYDINNESNLDIEADNKKSKISNTATVGMEMNIDKDSVGNFVLGMQYDKIHIKSDNGNGEKELDAANTEFSTDPALTMLGEMKKALFTITITKDGEVKSVTGYKELGEKLMGGLDVNDLQARKAAQQQWDQLIGEGMIRKNMEQLFTIFPDSALYVGDRWKLYSKQQGEFGLHVTTFYRLKEINNNMALIESRGEMVSDSTTADLMGNHVIPNLKGELNGEYEMDIKTGMMINSQLNSELKGTISMMGREIPINIENRVKIKGKRIK